MYASAHFGPSSKRGGLAAAGTTKSQNTTRKLRTATMTRDLAPLGWRRSPVTYACRVFISTPAGDLSPSPSPDPSGEGRDGASSFSCHVFRHTVLQKAGWCYYCLATKDSAKRRVLLNTDNFPPLSSVPTRELLHYLRGHCCFATYGNIVEQSVFAARRRLSTAIPPPSPPPPPLPVPSSLRLLPSLSTSSPSRLLFSLLPFPFFFATGAPHTPVPVAVCGGRGTWGWTSGLASREG